MAAQIPLPLGRFDRFDFDLFRPGPNRDAVASLVRLADGDAAGNVYLWGAEGTGKSHLLQAVCTRAAARNRQPAYLPLARLDELEPGVLAGLEGLDLVCLDDVEALAGRPDWEQATFHLYNRLLERGRPLITASRFPPRALPLGLADLKSRLGAGLIWRLTPLDEAERHEALRQRARSRGFVLPDEVIDYLSRRVARDSHSLFGWLDRLDRASLVSKKPLTVPFVRELLKRP